MSVRKIWLRHRTSATILTSSDSMALGAAAAVKAGGREGQVRIVGFDNFTAAQEPIREGRLLASADQHGGQLAVHGIDATLGAGLANLGASEPVKRLVTGAVIVAAVVGDAWRTGGGGRTN